MPSLAELDVAISIFIQPCERLVRAAELLFGNPTVSITGGSELLLDAAVSNPPGQTWEVSGSTIRLAHPLTVLAAIVAAPITSLTPVIGAGYVTAFVQAWAVPPRVRDFHTVADDAGRFRSWWATACCASRWPSSCPRWAR